MHGQSAVHFPGSRRIHVGLGVADLKLSRRFYETLLDVEPTKVRPGYVKFETVDPSVNLTLNEVGPNRTDRNPATHYGIQVKSAQAVRDAVVRFARAGLDVTEEEGAACCYAVQDKAWVTDPDGNRWEVFVVLDANARQRSDDGSTCCASNAEPSPAPVCC
jgi:catechol 2,3-dioxygenase-like lactoylglutathione lyase family enzyme